MRSFTKKNVPYTKELYYLIYWGKDSRGIDFNLEFDYHQFYGKGIKKVTKDKREVVEFLRGISEDDKTELKNIRDLRKILNHSDFIKASSQVINLFSAIDFDEEKKQAIKKLFLDLKSVGVQGGISINNFNLHCQKVGSEVMLPDELGKFPILKLHTANTGSLGGLEDENGELTKLLVEMKPNPEDIHKKLTDGQFKIGEPNDQTLKNISRLLVLRESCRYAEIRSIYQNIFNIKYHNGNHDNDLKYTSGQWINTFQHYVYNFATFDSLTPAPPAVAEPKTTLKAWNTEQNKLINIYENQKNQSTLPGVIVSKPPGLTISHENLMAKYSVTKIKGAYWNKRQGNGKEMYLLPVEDAKELMTDSIDHYQFTQVPENQGNAYTRTDFYPDLIVGQEDLFHGRLLLSFLERHYDMAAGAGYRKAKLSLVKSQGLYCAFCEGILSDGRNGDIEHKLPKSIFPTEALDFENFVHSCKVCNSDNKGEKIVSWKKEGLSYNFLKEGEKFKIETYTSTVGTSNFTVKRPVSEVNDNNRSDYLESRFKYNHEKLKLIVSSRSGFRKNGFASGPPKPGEKKSESNYKRYKEIAKNEVCWPDKKVESLSIADWVFGLPGWNDDHLDWKMVTKIVERKEPSINEGDDDEREEEDDQNEQEEKTTGNFTYTIVLENDLAKVPITYKLEHNKNTLNKCIIDICGLNGGKSNLYWNDQRIIRRTKISIIALRQLRELTKVSSNSTLLKYYSIQLDSAVIKDALANESGTSSNSSSGDESHVGTTSIKPKSKRQNTGPITGSRIEGLIAIRSLRPASEVEWDQKYDYLMKTLKGNDDYIKSIVWINILNMVRDGGFYSTWAQTFKHECIKNFNWVRYDLKLIRDLEVESQTNPEDPFQFHGTDAYEIIEHLKAKLAAAG